MSIAAFKKLMLPHDIMWKGQFRGLLYIVLLIVRDFIMYIVIYFSLIIYILISFSRKIKYFCSMFNSKEKKSKIIYYETLFLDVFIYMSMHIYLHLHISAIIHITVSPLIYVFIEMFM